MLYRHFNTLSEEEPEAQVELTTTIEELIAMLNTQLNSLYASGYTEMLNRKRL
ncbi:hypothetical protein ACFPK9_16115 [Rubritalea spongiae]|uniref:hypothetical protein n=1 Tax=Rubritalea spongiae TaxID=430797 RepID=UPI00361507C7